MLNKDFIAGVKLLFNLILVEVIRFYMSNSILFYSFHPSGINVTYVTGDHSYVLIRVARHRTMAKIGDDATELTPDQITLHDVVAKQANLVDPGDTSSVIEFVKSFGSHYISSYVTGNSLYQVRTTSAAILEL
jgi:hypothetical protein